MNLVNFSPNFQQGGHSNFKIVGPKGEKKAKWHRGVTHSFTHTITLRTSTQHTTTISQQQIHNSRQNTFVHNEFDSKHTSHSH